MNKLILFLISFVFSINAQTSMEQSVINSVQRLKTLIAEKEAKRDSLTREFRENFNSLLVEYEKACWADSTLEVKVRDDGWISVREWRSRKAWNLNFVPVVDMRWVHEKPTFEGFRKWLKKNEHRGNSDNTKNTDARNLCNVP